MSHFVAQACLKLLSLSNPSTSASRVASKLCHVKLGERFFREVCVHMCVCVQETIQAVLNINNYNSCIRPPILGGECDRRPRMQTFCQALCSLPEAPATHAQKRMQLSPHTKASVCRGWIIFTTASLRC